METARLPKKAGVMKVGRRVYKSPLRLKIVSIALKSA
jgi:hypothetical protein